MSSKIQSSLRKALEKVPGVIDAKVDYDHRTATVKYNPEKASPAAFVKATTNAGFPSKAAQWDAKVKPSDVQSVLTCPHCGHETMETMPSDSCLFFYQCVQCKGLIRPKAGDCCVFCLYGSTKCPLIQSQGRCCSG